MPNLFDIDREEDIQAKKKSLAEGRGISTGSGRTGDGSSTVKDDQEWKFFDTARIHVSGGDGGNGCVSFRREKGEPMGGPNGGNGGRGGSVYLVCDEGVNTLAPLRNCVHIRATKARNGLGKGKHGQKGKDIYMPVPPGTLIRELHTQKLAGELREDGEELLVARGGRGGRGNAAFMTQRNNGPKIAERAEPGAQRWLSIELQLVADVGFLGKPNAGKSTLLAASSAARPKIANYPFTTIIPNLGVCDISDDGAGLVLCDIPGLIEGKRIANPAYKGVWAAKMIANPEYKDDDTLYSYDSFAYVGIDVWQVKSGTIFDNILITDDAAVATAAAEKIKVAQDAEKAAKKVADDAKAAEDAAAAKKAEEEAAAKKAEEDAKKAEEDAAAPAEQAEAADENKKEEL